MVDFCDWGTYWLFASFNFEVVEGKEETCLFWWSWYSECFSGYLPFVLWVVRWMLLLFPGSSTFIGFSSYSNFRFLMVLYTLKLLVVWPSFDISPFCNEEVSGFLIELLVLILLSFCLSDANECFDWLFFIPSTAEGSFIELVAGEPILDFYCYLASYLLLTY